MKRFFLSFALSLNLFSLTASEAAVNSTACPQLEGYFLCSLTESAPESILVQSKMGPEGVVYFLGDVQIQPHHFPAMSGNVWVYDVSCKVDSASAESRSISFSLYDRVGGDFWKYQLSRSSNGDLSLSIPNAESPQLPCRKAPPELIFSH